MDKKSQTKTGDETERLRQLDLAEDEAILNGVQQAISYAQQHGHHIICADGACARVSIWSVIPPETIARLEAEEETILTGDYFGCELRDIVEEDDWSSYCPFRCGLFVAPDNTHEQEQEGGCKGESCMLFITKPARGKGHPVYLAYCGLAHHALGVYVPEQAMRTAETVETKHWAAKQRRPK